MGFSVLIQKLYAIPPPEVARDIVLRAHKNPDPGCQPTQGPNFGIARNLICFKEASRAMVLMSAHTSASGAGAAMV